jgi:hypothetical protein
MFIEDAQSACLVMAIGPRGCPICGGSLVPSFSLPTSHVFPNCDQFLYRSRGWHAIDELAPAICRVVKALNRALAHRFELPLERRKFLACHGKVGFRTAGHVRFLFAIVSCVVSISYRH